MNCSFGGSSFRGVTSMLLGEAQHWLTAWERTGDVEALAELVLTLEELAWFQESCRRLPG